MGDEDRLFKQLFQEFFGDLVSLMVPNLAPRLRVDEAEFLRGELFADAPETKRREVDLLAKVPTDRGEEELVLVHVEVEGQARSLMGRRMWQYAMLIRSRHELPLIPLVIYLRGGPSGVRKQTHREIVLGEEMVRFHFFSFGLSGSSAEEHLERPEPLAWALASLMQSRDVNAAKRRFEAFRRIAHARIGWNQKHLLARCVEYYLGLDAEERKEYQKMLAQRENDEVRSFENHWLNRMERAAEARGREEGKQEGMREGMQEGKQEGMQQLLILQVEQRFGTLPEATRQRIRRLASPDDLAQLASRILTADSLEELGLAE